MAIWLLVVVGGLSVSTFAFTWQMGKWTPPKEEPLDLKALPVYADMKAAKREGQLVAALKG